MTTITVKDSADATQTVAKVLDTGATTPAASFPVTLDTTITVAEDAAAAANPTGIVAIAVRRDVLSATEVSAENDNIALKATAKGQLHVYEDEIVVTGSATANGSITNFPVLMDGFESACIQVTSIGGGATFNWEWSNDGATVIAGPAHTIGTTGATGPSLTATAVGIYRTAKLGRYLHIRISSYTSGTPAATVLFSPATVVGMATVYAAGSGTLTTMGSTAQDGAASSVSPMVAGVEARTTNKAVMSADGDAVRAIGTMVGVPIVYPHSIPDKTWQYASAADVTDTTSTEMKAAAAGERHYVGSFQCSNTDATVGTYVNILSAAAVIGVVYVAPQVASTAGSNSLSVVFSPPLRGGVNEAINFQAVTTSAQLRAASQGFTSAH